ncbi:hypothetical protein SAMN04488085_12117 [Geodermatophilus ruber]|uniref:Uncharacterized protein n=1 Tax=Geodermatophilus ruber TaxID=504800 RepID=A0A1I4LC86_9ACTN|nr:hypothetical protein SAMN04488085_12117 [Geodermatophilus ruber]
MLRLVHRAGGDMATAAVWSCGDTRGGRHGIGAVPVRFFAGIPFPGAVRTQDARVLALREEAGCHLHSLFPASRSRTSLPQNGVGVPS